MQTTSLFNAEPGQPFAALQQRIDEIGDEAHRQQAEEPAAPREEIILVPGIFLHLLGEQQARQQIEEEGMAEHEHLEPPRSDPDQREFPPPEMHDHGQDRGDPDQVHRIEDALVGMLDDAGDAREDAGEAEAQHHADVEIDVVVADRVLPVPPRRCPRPSSGNPRLGDRG